jgi:hypothetical protein
MGALATDVLHDGSTKCPTIEVVTRSTEISAQSPINTWKLRRQIDRSQECLSGAKVDTVIAWSSPDGKAAVPELSKDDEHQGK